MKGLLNSCHSTCHYPTLRSKDLKILVPLKQSNDSSILGKEYASLTIWAFNLCRSIQNLRIPSFFLTNTTALAQELLDFLIAPISSISCKCFLTSSNWCSGILQYLSLKGTGFVSLIFIFNQRCSS